MAKQGLWFEDEDANRTYPEGKQVGNLDTGSKPYLLVDPRDGTIYDLSNIGTGGSSSYSDEDAQDAVGSALTSVFSYDDAANEIDVANGGIDTPQLAGDAVTAAKIATGAVGTPAIASGAVDTAELADDAVITSKILADNITTALIASGAVDTDQLAADAVTQAEIAADAIVQAAIANGAVGTAQLATDAVDAGALDLSMTPTWTGEHSFAGGITGLPTPADPSDAPTKEYVDGIKAGFDFKDPVSATSTMHVALGSSTDPNPIDGYVLADGDRVLLKEQNVASNNGIYRAVTATDPTTWVRADDADEDSEVTRGLTTFTENGDTNGGRAFILITDTPTLGTDSLNFAPFSKVAKYSAGDHLSKSGDTFNVEPQTFGLDALQNSDLAGWLEGTYSNRPAASTQGRIYYATDYEIVYRDTGSAWEAIGGSGTASNPLPGTWNFQSINTDSANITGLTEGSSIEYLTADLDDNREASDTIQYTDAVSTTATQILDGSRGNLALVYGLQSSGTEFSDLVLWNVAGGHTVIGSATRGSPAGRTYSVDSSALELSMASDTYGVAARAIGIESLAQL